MHSKETTVPKFLVKEAGRSYREHSGMGNPTLPSQPWAQHLPWNPPAGGQRVAAAEASPGWVTLLLQAHGPRPHEQGCQPCHIPVPTPYGPFPPPQDHVDPSTPSIPSSHPLQLQRSQGGSWGVLPPPHSFCWWVTSHSHLSQAAGGEVRSIWCQGSFLMLVPSFCWRKVCAPEADAYSHSSGRKVPSPRTSATKTSGRWRCHPSLLARLFCSSTPFITLL